jgi:hypothetical protein
MLDAAGTGLVSRAPRMKRRQLEDHLTSPIIIKGPSSYQAAPRRRAVKLDCLKVKSKSKVWRWGTAAFCFSRTESLHCTVQHNFEEVHACSLFLPDHAIHMDLVGKYATARVRPFSFTMRRQEPTREKSVSHRKGPIFPHSLFPPYFLILFIRMLNL